MALAVGAATAGNFSLFHAEPVDPRSGEPEAAIFCFPYGILVNVDGERFVDEARGPIDAWYERTTRDIQAQTEGVAWVILDAAGAVGARTSGPGSAPTSPPVTGRHDARSWRPASGSRPTTLEATVAAYNAACPDG